MAMMREAEFVYAASFGTGARVVGVTGMASGSGVTWVASGLAIRAARQKKTLLFDLSGRTVERGSHLAWHPDDTSIVNQIVQDPQGFSRLTAMIGPEGSFAFRSVFAMRQLLDETLASYQAIVVDLAPVKPIERVAVPVETIAAACDGLILVCLAGRITRPEAAAAAEALRTAKAQVFGIVVNDRDNPTTGEDIAESALRLRRFAPGLVRRIADLARRSAVLNSD
jgi:Mrp family chromosome partitioning ATPase